MEDYHATLYPGGIFHVLSRAIGDEILFKNNENYRFFLQQYKRFIQPVADTFCFCLLPNHFHFMIRVKDDAAIAKHYNRTKPTKAYSIDKANPFLMQCFSNLLNSYSKSFNLHYRRKGALFMDYLRRVEVNSESQFGSTIFYIHKNPVHHGCCHHIIDWYWSSYTTFLSNSPTSILREEVLAWYGGVEQFKDYHSQPIYLKNAAGLE